MSGIRSIPRRMAKPDRGIPTASSAGARVTTLELGTGATVRETRKVASTAPPTAAGGMGTAYRCARKTIAAPWKRPLPGRYIDAPSGSTRVAMDGDSSSFSSASSIITGRAATVDVVEKATAAPPKVLERKRIGPTPPTSRTSGRYTTTR